MSQFVKSLFILIIFFGIIYLANYYDSSDTVDPAMRGETFDVIAKNNQANQIHLIELNRNSIDKIINTINNDKKTVFILGNSQTQSVNQLKKNQSNLIEITSKALPEYNVISHTMPNMNFQEFWFSLCYWNSKISIDKVLVPVFFDDFRENEVRNELIEFAYKENFLIGNSDAISNKINNQINSISSSETSHSFGKLIEDEILQFLTSNFFIWENRQIIKTKIFVGLYNLRNTIFNIKPTSKRKVIKPSFSNNIKSLINVLKLNQQNNIATYMYIPPIRQDYEIPYELDEYLIFKNQVKDSILKYDANFKNFEDIIPPIFWGKKQSTNLYDETEIDFMHFRYEGHQILSDSIINFIK